MKPLSIVISLLLGLSALTMVVWVGRYGAKPPKFQNPEKKTQASVDDLPMPAVGPFGKAEVSETEFNFGAKNVGDKDEHVFKIKNVGQGPLEFKLGTPTCQCTIGEITREGGESAREGSEVITEGPIAPGESINILIKWVMKAEMAKFRQSVPVFTTDPDQRKIELAITGIVDKPLRLIPDSLWELGVISTSSPSTAEGYIASKVFEEFTLTEVPRANSRVKVSWEAADPDMLQKHSARSGYKIKVEVSPDVPIGQFREGIQVIAHTATGEFPTEFFVGGRRTGPIEVRGVVGANFNIETNRLFFGEFPAATGKKAKVTFIVKDLEEELVLKSVEPATRRVKITCPDKGKVFGKSKSYQVDIEIPPGPAARHRELEAESLELKFNHPAAPDLKLTVDYNAI